MGKTVRFGLHPAQATAMGSRAPVVAVIAGTGGGKTYLGPRWLYRRALERPEKAWLVVSPSYAMQQRVVLPGLMGFFREMFGPLGRYAVTTRTYTSPVGTMYFGTADNPRSLEGVHVAGAWLDEAGQMPSAAYEAAFRRVRFLGGQVLLTTTPYDRGWLFAQVYDRWTRGDADVAVVQFPSTANPAYPPEELERARRALPEWRFRMMHLGEFARPEGLVYPEFSASRIEEPFQVPAEWPRWVGLDHGVNVPTAAAMLAVDPSTGTWHAYREYYERERSIPEHVAALTVLTRGERIYGWWGDPSARQVWLDFRRLGLPVREADNAVLAGISTVSALLRENRLRVFRGCGNLVREFEGYRWLVREDRVTDAPRKEEDHLMDALRYAVHSAGRRTGRIGLWG